MTPIDVTIESGCRKMLWGLSQELCSCTSACSWSAGLLLPLSPSFTRLTSACPMSSWTQRVSRHFVAPGNNICKRDTCSFTCWRVGELLLHLWLHLYITHVGKEPLGQCSVHVIANNRQTKQLVSSVALLHIAKQASSPPLCELETVACNHVRLPCINHSAGFDDMSKSGAWGLLSLWVYWACMASSLSIYSVSASWHSD